MLNWKSLDCTSENDSDLATEDGNESRTKGENVE